MMHKNFSSLLCNFCITTALFGGGDFETPRHSTQHIIIPGIPVARQPNHNEALQARREGNIHELHASFLRTQVARPTATRRVEFLEDDSNYTNMFETRDQEGSQTPRPSSSLTHHQDTPDSRSPRYPLFRNTQTQRPRNMMLEILSQRVQTHQLSFREARSFIKIIKKRLQDQNNNKPND